MDPTRDEFEQHLNLPEDRPLTSVSRAAAQVLEQAGVHHLVGAAGCGGVLVARYLAEMGSRRVVLVVADVDEARRAAADLATMTQPLPVFGDSSEGHDSAGVERARPARTVSELLANGGGSSPLLVLASETLPFAEVHPDRRAAMTRSGTLFHIASGQPWNFLVVTAAALLRRVAPPALLSEAGSWVETGRDLDIEQLAQRLIAGGYLRVPVVEDAGSFAVRGGVVDVWSPTDGQPVRIELVGDTVQRVRPFDPDTQRTSGDLDGTWLAPTREAVITPSTATRARALVRSLCDAVNLPSTKTRQLVDDVASGKLFFGAEGFLPAYAELVPLWEYFGRNTPIVVDGGTRVVTALRQELEAASAGFAQRDEAPTFPLESMYVSESEVMSALGATHTLSTHQSGVAGTSPPDSFEALDTVPADTPTLAMHDHADLTRAVKAARATHGKQAALEPLVERLDLWKERGLRVAIVARAATQAQRVGGLLAHRGVDAPVVTGPLARGVLAPAEGFALVTEEEIFGQRAHRHRPRRRSTRSVLEDLRALVPGDYVVHVEHGVGRYLGLTRREIGGHQVELIEVEYVGGKLYLPVYRLDQVQKYSGGEGTPKIDRLGGVSFAKTKARVRRRVRQMADELLRLYAERAALRKTPLGEPNDEYATFEATFPYEETRDQAIAIDDVMRDISSDRVMDRLVCGDVGFGKTEVALRAAFRNALAGRQVALLCPTTVLAQQHLLTFTSRLADYPVIVRALSRFQSKREQTETVKGLKKGSVDIVIGTHRLLSKDVHFKNLGLLVVDEEQRFGVSHKERIKQMRASVDALTLTATPIPRTLQMAIGGLRDMSLITTPPVDRRAIRTVSSRFDPGLVKEAVERELRRGGQIFYVYNRVEGLDERAARLQSLVPEARIVVAHGQMSESALEKTMLAFVAGEFDVLVSTAIIESGLDIPRANTMIVDRADLFGLSQLYQLRGRVGRSSERAYCYLLVPPPSELSDDARSRLEALERHTELGAGFTIATLDMELRGAGEVLGADQSGFAASVGFDLFCQMLEEATQELRGEPVTAEVDPELNFDVEALIPEDYVAEVGVRLSLYKRLACAPDEDSVAETATEMEDRFGPAPPEAQRLVEMMRLKTELRRLRALGIEASKKSVTLHLREDTPLDPAAVGALVADTKKGYRLSPDGRLTRRFELGEAMRDGFAAADRVLAELAVCVRADSS